MKSNEEFIAGIYEKAAVYTEEKETKTIKTVWVAKATRIAAMMAVCIGLAGIGSLVLGNGNNHPNQVPQPGNEDYGIALTSETEDNQGEAVQLRVGPDAEKATVTGIVEAVDREKKRITIKLLSDKSIVIIKWDMMEPVSEDIVEGAEISATGVLLVHNECEELVVTNTTDCEIK